MIIFVSQKNEALMTDIYTTVDFEKHFFNQNSMLCSLLRNHIQEQQAFYGYAISLPICC